MKRNYIFLLWLITTCTIHAQNVVWVDKNETRGSFSFKLLNTNSLRKDTLDVVFHSATSANGNMTTQVFRYGTASLVGATLLHDLMAQSGEADTMKAIAKLMIATNDATLTSYTSSANSSTYKDCIMGTSYTDAGQAYNAFYRIVKKNKDFIVMSITSLTSDLTEMLSAKTVFLGSLSFGSSNSRKE